MDRLVLPREKFNRFIRFARVRAAASIALLLTPACLAQQPPKNADATAIAEVQRALGLAQQGDLDGALTLIGQLLRKDPALVPAWKLQGMVQEEAGRNDAAAKSFEEALRLRPNDPFLLFKVGLYQFGSTGSDQAFAPLERHTRLFPGDGDGFYYLAQAYQSMRRFDLAAKAMKECVRLNPNDPSLWQKYGEILSSAGDQDNGIAWLLKAQKADPSLERVAFDIASAYMYNLDYQNAAVYARQAVTADQRDVDARALLATAEAKLADWSDAVVNFERVLSSRSDDVPSLLELGHCKLELKDYQEAIDTLNHLLRVDPTAFQAHLYLSRAYFALGNTEEARHQAELHQRIMEKLSFLRSIDSDERESHIAPQATRLLAQHKEAEALELYRNRFNGSATSLGDPFVFIGKLYFYMDRPDDSLRCLKRALALQPNVRGAHTWMGLLDLGRKDYDAAEREFDAELVIHPNDQRAIAELGEVRYWQGRWADAAAQIEKSKTIEPELLFMLCDSYFHIGDSKNAALTAEIFAAFGRQNAPLMQQLIALLNRNSQQALAERLSADLTQP